MAKILVAEDEPALLKVICDTFVRAGHTAVGAPNGAEALAALEDGGFDMLVTDIMMPVMDGFALASQSKRLSPSLPILFLSARDDVPAQQQGFVLGIDDYVVKPFDPDLLVLRVEAILRRAGIKKAGKLTVGNFTMDSEEHTAYLDGEEVSFTVREFDILYKLLSYPKKTFTRSRLMEEFWDYDTSATSRTVDVYMAKIREKTAGCDGFSIVTVHGLGYKAVLS